MFFCHGELSLHLTALAKEDPSKAMPFSSSVVVRPTRTSPRPSTRARSVVQPNMPERPPSARAPLEVPPDRPTSARGRRSSATGRSPTSEPQKAWAQVPSAAIPRDFSSAPAPQEQWELVEEGGPNIIDHFPPKPHEEVIDHFPPNPKSRGAMRRNSASVARVRTSLETDHSPTQELQVGPLYDTPEEADTLFDESAGPLYDTVDSPRQNAHTSPWWMKATAVVSSDDSAALVCVLSIGFQCVSTGESFLIVDIRVFLTAEEDTTTGGR